MDLRPLRPKQVDVTKLRYSPVRTLDNGSKTVYVNYGPDKLTIQTPLLHIPYGIDTGNYDAKDGGKKGGRSDDSSAIKRYDLTVSFRGMDDNPDVKEFYDKMVEIEKKIVDDAFENRLAWLRDDYDGIKGVVGKLMSPMIKLDKDKETGKVVGRYPPTLKLKLPYDNANDDFNFEVTDMDRNALNLKECIGKLKGGRGRFLIQLTGIWIAGGKYGASWKVIFAKLQVASKSRYSFIDEDDEAGSGAPKGAIAFSEDEDLEEDAVLAASEDANTKRPKAAPVGKKTAAPALVEDSEEEEEDDAPAPEEDEEDDEPPPPPPKPAAKKAAPPPPPVEDEDDDDDEEEYEEPPPPPPKKTTTARKPASTRK